MGLSIGVTVVAIVMTPCRKQSGGHFNPAITFTFYRLGKVAFWDALFYLATQFAGAASGVEMATFVLRGALGNDAVRYAVTVPGIYGNAGAFTGEVMISFVLMATVLLASNCETLARYTPYLVGALYATFITFETPLSGMSMNPARTFGSAFRGGYWQALWIYFVPHWACWARERPSCGLAGVPLRTARSCTTPTTSAAYSTTDIEQRGSRSLIYKET